MTHAVGLRTYQIFVTQKGSSLFVSPDDPNLKITLPDFISKFVAEKANIKDITALERNWKLAEISNEGPGNSRGNVSYGRYGYAASIPDTKSGKENYRRKKLILKSPIYITGFGHLKKKNLLLQYFLHSAVSLV